MSILSGTQFVKSLIQPKADIGALLTEYLALIETNWLNSPRRKSGRPFAKTNWRFTREPKIVPHNRSREKRLEKAVATLGDGWANQVPTASGLWGGGDGKRSVDVVRKNAEDEFTLIELKIKTNDPWYATVEVLEYAVLYAFARRNGIPKTAILEAKKIHLWVLAPRRYYQKFEGDIASLTRTVNVGLSEFSIRNELPFMIDFEYRALAFPTAYIYKTEGEYNCDEVRNAFDNAEKLG